MTLTAFLISLFLPSAPAITDAVELARIHWRQSTARRQIEDDAHDVWEHYETNPARIPPTPAAASRTQPSCCAATAPGYPIGSTRSEKGRPPSPPAKEPSHYAPRAKRTNAPRKGLKVMTVENSDPGAMKHPISCRSRLTVTTSLGM